MSNDWLATVMLDPSNVSFIFEYENAQRDITILSFIIRKISSRCETLKQSRSYSVVPKKHTTTPE